jgi:sec-independent protein translocase protein TatB
MFDIGFAELMLIGVVALLVLGPEKLPGFARTVGGFVAKARASWNSMRAEIEREIAADELKRTLRETEASMRKSAESMQSAAQAVAAPVTALGAEIALDLSPEERARAGERQVPEVDAALGLDTTDTQHTNVAPEPARTDPASGSESAGTPATGPDPAQPKSPLA